MPPAPPVREPGVTGSRAVIKYAIIIYWSRDDGAFTAEVPELPGCAADGGTYQEALDNVQVIIREWIETAKERAFESSMAASASASFSAADCVQ